MILAGIQNKVSLYTKLKDSDSRLEHLFAEWLFCCGKTEEQLEEQSHQLRPSEVSAKFEESGEILENTLKVFKMIKQEYPNQQEVIDYLDFIDNQSRFRERNGSGSGQSSERVASESAALGRGEDYTKEKIPKLKSEIEDRFKIVKDDFESGMFTSKETLKELYDKLENVEGKLSDGGSFDLILKELYLYDKDVKEHEDWQALQISLVRSLMSTIYADLEEKRNTKVSDVGKAATASGGSNYGTFFKKQPPPTLKEM